MTVSESFLRENKITDEKILRSYILPQDPTGERTRLQAFHTFFNHIFEGEMIRQNALDELVPLAKAENRPLMVADVGTGTAVWPLHIAQTLRGQNLNAEIHGYDLIPDKFPDNLPENISLRVWNVNDLPKDEWKGKYDYVHIRLFVAAIPITQIPVVIDHAKQLLRPGGFLDWVDGSSGYCRVAPGNPQTEIGRQAFVTHLKVMGKDPFITDHLGGYITDAGFRNLEVKHYTPDDMETLPHDIKVTLTSCLAPATYSVLRNALKSENVILRNCMPVKTLNEAEELIRASEEEVRSGCTFSIPISRFLSQK